MWSLIVGLAAAEPEFQVVASEPLVQGQPGTLMLAAWDGELPLSEAPAVTLQGGQLRTLEAGSQPGLWQLLVVPDLEREQLLVSVGGQGRQISVGSPQLNALHGLAPIEAWVGEEVQFELSGLGLPPPEALVVVTPEGKPPIVEATTDGLRVRFTPGPSQEARVVLLGLVDMRAPGQEPAWVQVRLSRRADISLSTEPGSSVSVLMEGHTYGPQVAGADGKISLLVPVHPGQTEALAISVDPAGNRSETTITLALTPPPGLGVVAQARPRGPPMVKVHATTPRGRPWTGAAPQCLVSAGLALEMLPGGPGVWNAVFLEHAELPPDLQVRCSLGEHRVDLTLQDMQSTPSRIVLRAWPEELSSDFPVSQLQASLEDTRGGRLGLEGLTLSAEHGRVQNLVQEQGVLRGDYLGDAASPQDQVLAQWVEPPSHAPVHHMELLLARRGEGLEAVVRVFDCQGTPVQGAQVALWMGESTLSASSDARGRVRLVFDASSQVRVLRLLAGDAVHEGLVLPWVAYSSVGELGPDLQAELELHIRAGRVRKAELSVDHEVLYSGRDVSATVVVVLLDRSEVPVIDEAVSLLPDQGFVSELQPMPDGSLVAVYQPPPGMRAGLVTLRLEALDSGFESQAVRLEVLPPPLHRSPGLSFGGLFNSTGALGPYLSLNMETALGPPSPFSLRAELGVYRLDRQVELPSGGVDLRMEVLPLTLSGHRRWSEGLWSSWVGGGVVLAPYRSRSWFVQGGVEQLASRQIGLHSPGIQLYAGRGFRVRGGETYGEIRYLALGSRADEISGQVGGVTATLGFRVVY